MRKPITVEQLIKRLIAMPRNLPVVDMGKDLIEDVYVDKKYYDDGRVEDVVVVY